MFGGYHDCKGQARVAGRLENMTRGWAAAVRWVAWREPDRSKGWRELKILRLAMSRKRAKREMRRWGEEERGGRVERGSTQEESRGRGRREERREERTRDRDNDSGDGGATR